MILKAFKGLTEFILYLIRINIPSIFGYLCWKITFIMKIDTFVSVLLTLASIFIGIALSLMFKLLAMEGETEEDDNTEYNGGRKKYVI